MIRLHLTKKFLAGNLAGLEIEDEGCTYPDNSFHKLAMDAEKDIALATVKKALGCSGTYAVVGYRIERDPPAAFTLAKRIAADFKDGMPINREK